MIEATVIFPNVPACSGFNPSTARPSVILVAMLVIPLLAWGLGHPRWNPPEFSARVERLIREVQSGRFPELAKLLLVTEQYRNSNLTVIFERSEYDINSAVDRARGFLLKTYRGEPAESWVKTYLARSGTRGDVIYLKSPDGSRRPLQDVLLEELRNLVI